MRNALDWIGEELGALASAGLDRRRRVRAGVSAAVIEIDGRRVVNFGANDYLALASDPRLAAAAADATRAFGYGSGASPLVTGYSALHQRLEQRLARFMGSEATVLFSSGMAANLGTLPALVGREDAIFADAKNHASLIDGCRLSRATTHIYPHADVDALARMLRDAPPARRRLIVSDALFSMDGDLAPLDALADLADAHRAMLMVDEAHAVGVFGPGGRGVAEHLGVADRIDITTATLSKAFGCAGGFVAGRETLIDWLVNRARTYVFSTAHPPAHYAAAVAALDDIESHPERRRVLLEQAARLREVLAGQGWSLGSSASQIIPVVLGTPDRTMHVAAHLFDDGLFVPGIRPPSVPPGESLLRISLCSAHTEAMIAQLADALGRVRQRV